MQRRPASFATSAWICVTAIVVVVYGAPNCDLKKVDKCVGAVLFFAQNTSATTDPDDVRWECQQERTALECLNNYATSGCVSGIAQGVFKLIIEGAAQESTQKCDIDHVRNKEYYEYVPCINRAGTAVNACMKEMTSYVEAATRKPSNQRIPHTCCGFGYLIQCLERATAAKCDANHVEYVRSVVYGIAGDMLDTVCVRHRPGSASCSKLGRLKPSKTHKFNTMIPPVVEVLKSL